MPDQIESNPATAMTTRCRGARANSSLRPRQVQRAGRRERETWMFPFQNVRSAWLAKTRGSEREAKMSRTAALLAWQNGGRPLWTARSYAALARAGYMKNPIVYR